MTAKSYLKGRASAVYNTWGRNVPGRIAFFSSEDSYSEGKQMHKCMNPKPIKTVALIIFTFYERS
jgi:hypothetical protein